MFVRLIYLFTLDVRMRGCGLRFELKMGRKWGANGLFLHSFKQAITGGGRGAHGANSGDIKRR